MGEFRFGPYALNGVSRSLTRQGQTIPLGSRAVDILLFLVSEPGKLRSNEEIISHAWPNTFVDQSNLRVHMSAIRKALGTQGRDGEYIANIPGRGYQFVGHVESAALSGFTVQTVARTGIFGRDDAIASIAQLLVSGLVTIVGPGGIGKSTVARGVTDFFGARERMLWVDLAELESGEYLESTIASALGLPSHDQNVVRAIATTLVQQERLLVLDSCEHIVDQTAQLVEALRDSAPALVILATSREPLRVTGERVYRLPPLTVPLLEDELEKQRLTPAIQLFLDRAVGQFASFELGSEELLWVAEICRRLDGIALAIELAAARLESVSLHELATSLEQSFRLLTRGRRTAFPRHRTLRATLDWSYDILPPAEQIALQRLSVLRGWFSFGVADAVMCGSAAENLHELVSKSLVVADSRNLTTRYRLLDTTRFYAAEKLAETGQQNGVLSQLAHYLIGVLEAEEEAMYAAADGPQLTFSELVAHVRVALAWSLVDDAALGVKLTVASVPLFFRLALLDECLEYVTTAISHLDAHPGLDEPRRMKLYAALGWPQMRPSGGPRDGAAAWSTALSIAEDIGDIDYQLRALWALWVDAINQAKPEQGLQLAKTFADRAVRSSDEVDRVVGLRLVGATHHWLGRHAESQLQLERMLKDYDALPSGNSAFRFQFDQRITARVVITRNLWALGQEAEALQMLDNTIRLAIEMNHELSLANYLAEAGCPIALLSDRLDLAEEMIALLRHHTKALSLDVWNNYADCFDAELHLLRGEPARCLEILRPSCAILAKAGFVLFQAYFQSVEARALTALACNAEATSVIVKALDACAMSGERWCLPELLRVKSFVIAAEKAPKWKSLALTLLHEATLAARADGARAWEQRIELDLARLSTDQPAEVARSNAMPASPDERPGQSRKTKLH